MEMIQRCSRILTTWIDPTIWQAYQIGLILGIGIVSALILFPGVSAHPPPPLQQQHQHQQPLPPNKTEQLDHSTHSDSPHRNGTNGSLTSSLQTPPQSVNKSSFDNSSSSVVVAAWTPHRRLNTAVYGIICTVATVAILQLYSDGNSTATTETHQMALFWRAYFPKETAVLWGQPVTRTLSQRQAQPK